MLSQRVATATVVWLMASKNSIQLMPIRAPEIFSSIRDRTDGGSIVRGLDPHSWFRRSKFLRVGFGSRLLKKYLVTSRKTAMKRPPNTPRAQAISSEERGMYRLKTPIEYKMSSREIKASGWLFDHSFCFA